MKKLIGGALLVGLLISVALIAQAELVDGVRMTEDGVMQYYDGSGWVSFSEEDFESTYVYVIEAFEGGSIFLPSDEEISAATTDEEIARMLFKMTANCTTYTMGVGYDSNVEGVDELIIKAHKISDNLMNFYDDEGYITDRAMQSACFAESEYWTLRAYLLSGLEVANVPDETEFYATLDKMKLRLGEIRGEDMSEYLGEYSGESVW